jgi:hypothetical protein
MVPPGSHTIFVPRTMKTIETLWNRTKCLFIIFKVKSWFLGLSSRIQEMFTRSHDINHVHSRIQESQHLFQDFPLKRWTWIETSWFRTESFSVTFKVNSRFWNCIPGSRIEFQNPGTNHGREWYSIPGFSTSSKGSFLEWWKQLKLHDFGRSVFPLTLDSNPGF